MKRAAVLALLTLSFLACDALAPEAPEVRSLRRIDKVWVTFDARDLLDLPQPAEGQRGASWAELLAVAKPTTIVHQGSRYLLAFTLQQVDLNAEMHTQVLMPTETLAEKALLQPEPLGVIVRRPHAEVVVDPEGVRAYLGLPEPRKAE